MLIDKVVIFSLSVSMSLPLAGLYIDSFFVRLFYLNALIVMPVVIANKVYLSPHIKILFIFNVFIALNFFIAPSFVNKNILILPASEAITFFKDLNLTTYLAYGNFTQLFYPFFWLLFVTLFSSFLAKKNRLIFFYKSILLSYFICSVSGYIYMIHPLYFENLFIFFLNYHDAGYFSVAPWGYGYINLRRMASLVGEPSNNLLFTLFISGPLILSFLKKDHSLFKYKVISKLLCLMVISNILLIQSSAAFIAVLFIILLLFNYFRKKSYIPINLIYFTIFGIIALFLISSSVFDKVLNLSLSGQIRYELNAFVLQIIYDNLMLGIGFGTQRTTTFILYILVSLGILGLSIWLYFIYKTIFLNIKTRDSNINTLYDGFKISFIVITALSFISFSESIMVLPFYFLNMVFLISIFIKCKQKL